MLKAPYMSTVLQGLAANPEWAQEIRRAGYELAVYTVNDPKRAVELAAWGAHCFITDRPDLIINAF